MTRRFRAFAEKEDLIEVFARFQSELPVCYVPAYSDSGPVVIQDITRLADLGVNYLGEHIGNMQFRVMFQHTECVWRAYQCPSADNKARITRHTSLCDGNTQLIDIDLGGIYQGNRIFPTEISTIHYGDEDVKRLFNKLRSCFRRSAVKTVNGYFIGPRAYEDREKLRFCTISIRSPQEYDLKVQ